VEEAAAGGRHCGGGGGHDGRSGVGNILDD
jgi:hypothetical protein